MIKITELDTIKTEHNFMQAGDPVPVNQFDDHDAHIKEHETERESLTNKNLEVYTERYMNLLDAHIELHKEYKSSM